jgi:hypothetical protein
MKCPKCGRNVNKNRKRCPYCGQNLEVEREAHRLKHIGALAIVAILLAGSAVFVVAARGLEGNPFSSGNQMLSSAVSAGSDDEATASVSSGSGETVQEEQSIGGEIAASSEEKSSDETDKLTAELTEDQEITDLSGYSPVTVKSAEATSVMPANDGSNIYRAESAVDGDEKTSWQEGESGDGIGSTLTLHFDREYSVRYVVMKLGNWRSDSLYEENNRPKTLSIMFGEESVQVTVPDEKKEVCVTLSKDVKASDMTLRIDDVYSGSKYDDTCIAEISVRGY